MAVAALCLAGAPPLPLADGRFTLEWHHSVEHVAWREFWEVTPAGMLALTGAAVRGSGAGMEPGEGAVLADGWWRWPVIPPRELPELLLGASGATGAGWLLCDPATPDRCREIGATPGAAIALRPCRAGSGGPG